MTGKHQTVAIMAASIYAAKAAANVKRARLATLRREAIAEASQLLEDILDEK